MVRLDREKFELVAFSLVEYYFPQFCVVTSISLRISDFAWYVGLQKVQRRKQAIDLCSQTLVPVFLDRQKCINDTYVRIEND